MKPNITLTLLAVFFLYFGSFAQNKEAQIKVAYIYRFAENIKWPNEEQKKNYTIACPASDNDMVKNLKILSKSKEIKGKKIKLITYENLNDLSQPYPEIIYYPKEYHFGIKALYTKIKASPALLVSDRESKQKFVMLNFIMDNSKLTFEVNKKTIEDQKLKILPKLLLLGGKEIDVRELYRKQEKELEAERKKVKKQKEELKRQEAELKKQKKRIKKLNAEITQKQEALEKQEAILEEKLKEIENQKLKLRSVNRNLAAKEALIKTKEDQLKKQLEILEQQNRQVSEAKEKLKNLNTEITEKEKQIKKKQKELNQKQKELGLKDETINLQKRLIIVFVIILIIILGLAFLLIRTNKARKKANDELRQKEHLLSQSNEELSQKNEEINIINENISNQKEIIETQYGEMRNSISYAVQIQTAILPPLNLLKSHFNISVLYLPKDIVSGDFYWFAHLPAKNGKGEKKFIAAVDCTGHGVPGAFMSMIGSRLLNEIVNEKKITETNQILDELDKGVAQALKQSETGNDDGMDVCLCRIEDEKNGRKNIYFTGAKRPLLIYRSKTQKTQTIKGDRRSIGGRKSKLRKTEFTSTKITTDKNDVLYLTSDGYTDQNDEKRAKIGLSRFSKTIPEFATQEPDKQKETLHKILKNHKKSSEQRDDIVVITLKI